MTRHVSVTSGLGSRHWTPVVDKRELEADRFRIFGSLLAAPVEDSNAM